MVKKSGRKIFNADFSDLEICEIVFDNLGFYTIVWHWVWFCVCARSWSQIRSDLWHAILRGRCFGRQSVIFPVDALGRRRQSVK